MLEKNKTSREILNTVSRTFALNIPLLDDNKIAEVENQYLLMRFLDTIEDSNLPLDEKKGLLMSSTKLLASEKYGELEKVALNLKEKTIDEHDKLLLDNFGAVLSVFDSFDTFTKGVSIKWLDEMSFGMHKYIDQKINTFNDLDEYCYYVAGTVGLYLNGIVRLKDNVSMNNGRAMSFGRFLQKVNIIKDFYKDSNEGRHFWPSEAFSGEELEKNHFAINHMCYSALKESVPTFEYIKSIPDHIAGYRKFCTLPALLAIKTLKLLYGNPLVFSDEPVKVRREDVMVMLQNTKDGCYTNEVLDGIIENECRFSYNKEQCMKLVNS
jgi:farnesyl-diphosphate farnesyltransferase